MTRSEFAQFRPGHASRNPATSEQRLAGIVAVTAIHAVVIYALLHVLGFVPMPPPASVFTTHFLEAPPAKEDFPPPPSPTVAPPVPTVTPLTEVPLTLVPPQEAAITPPRAAPQSAVPPVMPVAPPPVFHPARAISATHTIPDYPPISRRLGEQGTLRLRLAIDTRGQVTDASLVRSSGFRRLDEAAIDWVKTHWRYEPATSGGKPVPSSAEALLTFQLH